MDKHFWNKLKEEGEIRSCRTLYSLSCLASEIYILETTIDNSPPGKDLPEIVTHELYNSKGKKIDPCVFLENGETQFDVMDLSNVGCGLMSYHNRFYDISLKKIFELPCGTGLMGYFDEETKEAFFFESRKVLIKVVKGKVYYMLDVTGIDALESKEELMHDTPVLLEGEIDGIGNKVMACSRRCYPTIANQYLRETFDSYHSFISDSQGGKICGDGILRAYNQYLYLFRENDKFCVYTIYGDWVFDIPLHAEKRKEFQPQPLQTCYCENILLQENGLFFVQIRLSERKFRSNRDAYLSSKMEYDIYDYDGSLLNDKPYSKLRNFACGRAYYEKDGTWGFLKYTKGKGIEELCLKEYYNVKGLDIPDFDNQCVCIESSYYDINLCPIEGRYPKVEIKFVHIAKSIFVDYDNVEQRLFYDNREIDYPLKDKISIRKDLGGGLFVGEYALYGKIDKYGNVLEKEGNASFPIVFVDNMLGKYEYRNSKKGLNEKMKYLR